MWPFGSGRAADMRPSHATRQANAELWCLQRRLELSRDKCEKRIQKLAAQVADLRRAHNISQVSRRKQAMRGLLLTQNRLDVICGQIAGVEARRDRNEDIGTMLELQASTTNAMQGLQSAAPEIFTGNTDAVRAMAHSDQLLHRYEENMGAALDLMNGPDESDARIEEQVEESERAFMRECELAMAVPVPETRIRAVDGVARQKVSPVAATAAASARKSSDDEDNGDEDDKKHGGK